MRIESDDQTSRFLFRGQFLVKPEPRAKPNGFMPNPKTDPLSTSVFITTALEPNEIHELARQQVEPRRGRTIKAWASLSVDDIQSVADHRLEVKSEPSTHELHANILGWPQEEDARLEAALDLATASELVLVK